MIARFHYDDETLTQLLGDEPVGEQIQVAQHVETCVECQTRLETITQDGLTLEEVGEILRDDKAGGETELDSRAATFLQPSDQPDSLGRFSRYEILEILGRGGMGIVMRGFDPALNRQSAVKVLAPELATSAAARQRFSREAKSAAAVVHQHVIPIQTVDEHDGIPYFVMPVVEGKSLQERVASDGPLPIIEVVRIAAQIAEGLAAAHAQGLIHRDIKPANILLENGVERVQITDFGLARAADDANMTHSGVIIGTPQYMSPEQAHGDEIDHRSDLFSLGSVMYFMLTRRSPFRAETTMGVLNRIANDQPRRLSTINSEIPQWLESVIGRLLEKAPGKRFDSTQSVALELNERLQQLQDPSRKDPSKTTSWGRAFPPVVVGAMAAAALAGLIYLGVVVFHTPNGTIRIETNDDIEQAIPVIIKQNDRIVGRMEVDADGGMARVRAGDYQIEVAGENTSFELQDDQATVSAGGVWTTKIKFDPPEKSSLTRNPSDVRSQAREDQRHGRYDQALEKLLWCWENAEKVQPSWSAVRRSFLVSSWLELAEEYPPALVKMKSVRDELESQILSKEQVRVRSDDFADLSSLNHYLRENDHTMALFEKLDIRDQKRVVFYLPECPEIPNTETRQTSKCKDCHRPGKYYDGLLPSEVSVDAPALDETAVPKQP